MAEAPTNATFDTLFQQVLQGYVNFTTSFQILHDALVALRDSGTPIHRSDLDTIIQNFQGNHDQIMVALQSALSRVITP